MINPKLRSPRTEQLTFFHPNFTEQKGTAELVLHSGPSKELCEVHGTKAIQIKGFVPGIVDATEPGVWMDGLGHRVAPPCWSVSGGWFLSLIHFCCWINDVKTSMASIEPPYLGICIRLYHSHHDASIGCVS